jgi:hypothetical protein
VSGVGPADSQLSVDDANSFPDAGTVRIDNEQISYTSKFGNTLLGVRRGVNGTTAASHATGAVVSFLSASVPTPPRPTPTEPPRGHIIRVIGEGGGCSMQAGEPGGVPLLLSGTALAMWARRRRARSAPRS